LRAALDREQELARSIAGFTRQQRQQQHEQKAYYAATLGLIKEGYSYLNNVPLWNRCYITFLSSYSL